MSRLWLPKLVVGRNNAMQRELSKPGENREAFADMLRPACKINLIVLADVNQVSRGLLQREVDGFASEILVQKNWFEIA